MNDRDCWWKGWEAGYDAGREAVLDKAAAIVFDKDLTGREKLLTLEALVAGK